jgi:hypothetical protein
MTLRACLALALACAAPVCAAPQPLLVVLQPTGQIRNGLPVLTPHRQAAAVDRVLTHGFSGRLVRLYAMEQEYLRRATGIAPEPAYLLLSTRQGGFPQVGFSLDGQAKPSAGWVDLHRSSSLAGRFGAMDQVFPHELLHVIVRQLAGEPRESGSNQVHAIGVRTDPVTAFQEGFAEHAQILSIDDPEAMPDTAALAGDLDVVRRTQRELDGYGRDLAARLVLVSPGQLRFLLWFSSAEQGLRYHAVKANLFARDTPIPSALLARKDKFGAYLFQSVLPGSAADPAKSAGVLLSTEGVVAHLFWRWTTDRTLQQRYRDEAFYAMFGTRREDVSPLENVYLKIFHALFTGRPGDTAGMLRAYASAFPDEAPTLQRLVSETLIGQVFPDAPEIWLANGDMQTGTSLFDQFRAIPRPHTFDVNAASRFDWLAVPGVTADAAAKLLSRAPYRDLESLMAASDVDPALRQRIPAMASAMSTLRARGNEQEESLSLATLVKSYVWRLAAVLGLAAMAATWLARRVGARRWWSAATFGVVATVLVLTFAWVITSPSWLPVVTPLVAGGLPAALWTRLRKRSWPLAARSLAAWGAASLPALVVSRSWW